MKIPRRQLVLSLLLGIPAIGLACVVYVAAFGRTSNFDFWSDLQVIGSGLDNFKTKYGAYPPSHQDELAVASFHAKVFPRATDFEYLQATLTGDSKHLKSIDDAEALVLYLGFLSRDRENPYWHAIQMASDSPRSSNPTWKRLLEHREKDLMTFYEFPDSCLVDRDGDGFPEFAQRQVKGKPVLELGAVLRPKVRVQAETNRNSSDQRGQ